VAPWLSKKEQDGKPIQKYLMTNHSAPPDEQAFPVLDVLQIAKLRPFGTTRSACANEVLIEIGDDIPGLFVVLEGQTRIIDRANEERVIRTSGPGEFNGELGILTGQRAFVARVVTEPGALLFVPTPGLSDTGPQQPTPPLSFSLGMQVAATSTSNGPAAPSSPISCEFGYR
jgi:hypothetical protein